MLLLESSSDLKQKNMMFLRTIQNIEKREDIEILLNFVLVQNRCVKLKQLTIREINKYYHICLYTLFFFDVNQNEME